MSPRLLVLDINARRLAGVTVAAAALLLSAACGSSGAGADNDAPAPDGSSQDVALATASESLVVALGPSVGPVAPTVEQDVTPPGLVVVSPLPNSQVSNASYVFQGFTEPGATVSAGPVSTVAEESGRWSLELLLTEGANTAVVKSTDSAGNEFEKVVTVNFEYPKPAAVQPPKEHDEKPEAKPEATPKKEHDFKFSAWTKFGVCSTEPFAKSGGEGSKDTDVLTKFKGSGVPGTTVQVISPYGGGTAEVDDSGYWWIKVEFEDEAGQNEFTAVVTHGDQIARFHCGAS